MEAEFKFDTKYFNKLAAFINSRDNVTISIESMTNEPEKFIWYLKYYIEYRTPEMIEILLIEPQPGQEYTHFKIYEFFDWVLWEQNKESRNNKVAKPLPAPVIHPKPIAKAASVPVPMPIKKEPKPKVYDPFVQASIF